MDETDRRLTATTVLPCGGGALDRTRPRRAFQHRSIDSRTSFFRNGKVGGRTLYWRVAISATPCRSMPHPAFDGRGQISVEKVGLAFVFGIAMSGRSRYLRQGLARSFSSGPAGRRRSTDKKPLTHSAGRRVSASGRKCFRLAARSRRRSSGRGLQQARRACAAAMAGSAGQARPPTDPWPMTSTSRRLARACLCVLVRACAQAGRRRRAVWPVNCNLSPACGWLENRIILAAPTQKPVFSRSQRGQVHGARSDLSGYLVSIFPLICRL